MLNTAIGTITVSSSHNKDSYTNLYLKDVCVSDIVASAGSIICGSKIFSKDSEHVKTFILSLSLNIMA